MPLWTRIAGEDFNDSSVVAAWINALFDHFEARRNTLRTFSEMSSVEPHLLARVEAAVSAIITQLGDSIPGFAAARGDDAASRKRWCEAWLVLWNLREQCGRNATGRTTLNRDIIVETLTEAFLRVAKTGDTAPRHKRTKRRSS
jgi:hypothetical protein